MSKKRERAVELEELEKPAAELTSEEAAEASGGVILMPVLTDLELFEIKGVTFPTASDSNDGRQTKP
jgi:hypothetical protein